MVIMVKIVLDIIILNVVSAYALQIGLNGSDKKSILDSMDGLLQDICLGNRGNLSCQVGKKRDVNDTIHGGYEFLQNNDVLIWEKLSLTLLWLLAFDLQ